MTTAEDANGFTPTTFESWQDHFKPIANVGTPTSFEIDNKTTLFETYGPDFEEVKRVAAQEPNRIWTLLDSDGVEVVSNGFHHVNRMGYFITEVPWSGEGFLDIPVYDEADEDFGDDLDDPTN